MNTGKPPETQVCSCDEISCIGDSTLCPAKKADWFEPESPYTELGCFNLLRSHYKAAKHGHSKGADFRDLSCQKHKGTGPCKSGLPFYSVTSNAMSPSLCFSFCTSKGLDIFGLVKGAECRCGFSAINRNARLRGPLEPALQFLATRLTPHRSVKGVCPLRVFRYSGYFEAGGLPSSLVKLTDVDTSYFRRIFHGWNHFPPENDVWYATHPPTPKPHGGPAKVDFSHRKNANGNDPWDRSCYPDNCGPGGGPWPKRDPYAPKGVYDQFQLYCPIPYFFTDKIDDARKEVFRHAVRTWHELTCVVLIEYEEAEITDSLGPYIEVTVEVADKCYATQIGYPGYWNGRPDKATINLGWCNSMYNLGDVIHEIGHVIGMNHEQKRADSTQKLDGHGPYLRIFCDTLQSETSQKQYTTDDKSYMGSDSQGPGDPHHGYAPYDYGSIMHYGRTGHFEPLAKENVELLGNRDHLSESDILQINDMYQCKELDSPSIKMDCDFESDPALCNWVNVGEDSSKWQAQCLSNGNLGSGPDHVHDSGDCYVYAEADGHPSEVFILESPSLSSFRDYTLKFSYYRSGTDAQLSVQYESVVGKLVEVYKDHGNTAEQWITKEVKIFGDEAVTVRFQLLTTDKSTSGAALDHVTLVLRSQRGRSHSSSHQKNFLEFAVEAFNNLLDAIFSKKYEDSHIRGRAVPARGAEEQVAESISPQLQVLTVAVVASVAFFGLFFALSRHRFRSLALSHVLHENDRLIDDPEIFSAREIARDRIPSDVI